MDLWIGRSRVHPRGQRCLTRLLQTTKTVIAVDHGSTPKHHIYHIYPYLSISIHIYSLHFRALEHKGLDYFGLTSKFHGMAPKFGWMACFTEWLPVFFPVFFPHLAIKIPWGSLKCDLCGSWCGSITAAEFARFTPFQQAAQWPWLRSERSERSEWSECRCQGTPPLKSTWKQPPDREKYVKHVQKLRLWLCPVLDVCSTLFDCMKFVVPPAASAQPLEPLSQDPWRRHRAGHLWAPPGWPFRCPRGTDHWFNCRRWHQTSEPLGR